MKTKVIIAGKEIPVIIHNAEEGGYWAEFPTLPGCLTEGDTREELLFNRREAAACHLDLPELPEIVVDEPQLMQA